MVKRSEHRIFEHFVHNFPLLVSFTALLCLNSLSYTRLAFSCIAILCGFIFSFFYSINYAALLRKTNLFTLLLSSAAIGMLSLIFLCR